MTREFHPLAEIFPLVEGTEFDELVADIKANGLHEPIVVFEDKILDGRNRYRACMAAGVEPTFTAYTGDDSNCSPAMHGQDGTAGVMRSHCAHPLIWQA